MSVRQQAKDRHGNRRWRARWRDPSGREVAKVFDTKRDASLWVAAKRTDAAAGRWVDSTGRRVTFGEFAEAWVTMQPGRPSTAVGRRSALRAHLYAAFGDRPLASVRPSEVQAFARSLADRLSPGTVHNVMSVFAGVFRAAVADRLVAVNPAEGVRLERYAPRREIPTAEQVEAMQAATPDRYQIAVVFASAAGLRSGEVRGLTVDRVDWLRRQLTVDRQSVGKTVGEVRFGPPKSSRSVRAIPLADPMLEALARHVELFGTGSDGLVVCDEAGRPVVGARWAEMWRRVQHETGLTVRFHDLRHFAASMMLSRGVPVPMVAQMLGDTPSIVLRCYAHPVKDDDDRVRAAMAEAFADSTRTTAQLA